MNNKPEQYTQEERAAARRAIKRANLITAGFVISHLTHPMSKMGDAVMRQWQREGDHFVKLLLTMGFQAGPFNALVDVQTFHPIAFQYGQRFYFN